VEEQVEIIGEINDILRRNRLAIRPETFTFTPRRKGAALPILVISGAAAFTLAAALGLFALFNAGERDLVSRSAVLVTAEARLIQALKKESEEQLGRKDQEIARIQGNLESLARDRDRLKLDSQAQLARREEELKSALARELTAERQKLEREGLKSDAVERQLTELEGRLAEENRKQLADFRRQAEAELASKDASLAAMNRQYTESLAAFRQERASLEQQARQREQELSAQARASTAAAQSETNRLAGQLQAFTAQREQEKLASDQLLAAYAKAFDSWKASRYDEALRNLGAVRDLLSREAITSLPAIRSRLPVERSLVEALSVLFEGGKTASAPDAAVPAARASAAALSEAESRLAAANRNLAVSERERRRLQEESAGARQELARLQAAERRRAAQEAQVAALQERLAAGGAADTTQAQVLALLETKLRVRQALSTEPLASRYPGLYEELERYLEAFGQEQRQEGQAVVWQEVAAVLEGLALKAPRLDARRLASGYTGRAREPFQRFVARLREALK
jgi:chromosome segregation ATPase